MLKEYSPISTNSQDWIDEIISIINKAENDFVINITNYEPDHKEFISLLKLISGKYLSYKDWNNQIWVKSGIATKTILEKRDLIIQAANKFRETAQLLMKKLAGKYNADFESGDGIYELRELNNHENRINELDEEWKFNFHGYECLLTNSKTGQMLDTIFITRPEFGVLDPFFFLKYINTTPEWVELKGFFEDNYDRVDQTLLTLEANGFLSRVLEDSYSSRGLIVK